MNKHKVTTEITLRLFPNNFQRTKEDAATWGRSKIGGTTLVEVGDKYSPLTEYYDILKYRILDTRIEIELEEPLQGKVIGICELIEKD